MTVPSRTPTDVIADLANASCSCHARSERCGDCNAWAHDILAALDAHTTTEYRITGRSGASSTWNIPIHAAEQDAAWPDEAPHRVQTRTKTTITGEWKDTE